MRSKKVTRHYCDHCGKGRFHKPAMVKHERICFQNPKRSCWLCDRDETDIEQNKATLLTHGLKALLNSESCPACIMAACIQVNIGAEPDEFFHYETYKEDLAAWRSGSFGE